jgi:GR25 family glycosyltransferase involved in LPS biosynthesis
VKSFAYIVCWDDVHYNVIDNIEKQFIDYGQPHKIINSGNMKRDHWDNVGDIRYFRQFYKALKEFDFSNDFMIFICGDVSYDNWAGHLDRANQVLSRYKNIHVYAPHFTNDPWHEGSTSLGHFPEDKNLLISTNTNGIMYYLHRDIVLQMLEYFDHLYENTKLENMVSGWGIDLVWSALAVMNNKIVVRDKQHIITHPKGSSYDHAQASHETNLVFENFRSFCKASKIDLDRAIKLEQDIYKRMGKDNSITIESFYGPSFKIIDNREINYHIIHIDETRRSNRDRVDEVLMSNKLEIPSLDARTEEARAKFFEDNPEFKLSWDEFKNGEIGNFGSHYLAWKFLAESDLENILIFEDDILIENDFIKKYNIAIDNVPADYDVLSIFVHPNQYDRFDKTQEISYYIAKGYQDWSTLCYVVSKSGAKKLINYLKEHGMSRPTDWFIFRGGNEGAFNVYTLPPHFKSPVSIDTRYESQVQ